MIAIDLVVGLVVVVAALAGARLGLERALPYFGVAAGVLLGSRVPLLVGEQLDSDYALNIAVVAALALGGIGAALGESVARRARGFGRRRFALSTGSGAILMGAAAVVLVWALAPPVSKIRSMRDDVGRSEVLAQLNAVLAPVRPPRDKSAPSRYKPTPGPGASGSKRRMRPPAIGDPRLRERADVKRAESNLVRVDVDRCGGGFQGTGWVAGHGVVVTNAHVVTEAKKVTVSEDGVGPPLAAEVIWFDGIHDLALLRVGALRSARGLPLAADPPARPSVATPVVLLGFVRGKLTIRRGLLGGASDSLQLPPVKLASTAGISLTMRNRLVAYLRGISGPGGSGSPVVNREGHVVATVFAGITTSDITLAVPNHVVRAALRRADHRVEVPSCDAPPLKPTREQSIAARNGRVRSSASG